MLVVEKKHFQFTKTTYLEKNIFSKHEKTNTYRTQLFSSNFESQIFLKENAHKYPPTTFGSKDTLKVYFFGSNIPQSIKKN